LSLNENGQSTLLKETVELLETEKEFNDEFTKFKWKLYAFVVLQDIFDSPIFENEYKDQIFFLWYFYYESKYLLTEMLLSGFNGFYAASGTLVRLFLEFSLLQNYFYRVSKEEHSYKKVDAYYKNGIAPSWNSVLNWSLPKDNFSKPVKKRLDIHLKSLSKTTSHPYLPDFSAKQHTTFHHEPSIYGLYFWKFFEIVLDAVLWLYFVNFPMLFHPRDRLKKFGFSGPSGLFIDEFGAYVIKNSSTTNDYKDFLSYSNSQEDVKSLLEWYDSFNDLNEDEIMQTWSSPDDEPIKSIQEGYSKDMAKGRIIREIAALKIKKDVYEKYPEPEEMKKYFSFSNWKRNYKKY
jgi:hypothetical protein